MQLLRLLACVSGDGRTKGLNAAAEYSEVYPASSCSADDSRTNDRVGPTDARD